MIKRRRISRSVSPARVSCAAFTLTELLVVIAVLAILAATQLPALTRPRTSSKFTRCLNNLRQIGQAVMLYRADNSDCFPFGERVTSVGGVTNMNGWPMKLLRYMGGYTSNAQPAVYVCPSELRTVDGPFAVHYQANRGILRETSDTDLPFRGSQIRQPAAYWMFIEKDPISFCSVRAGGLANPVMMAWNIPPGYPGHRRHNGGMTSAAADGHVTWLRMPPYQPGRPSPQNLLELGDCANGQSPGSTWQSDLRRVKLFSRYSVSPSPGGF